MNIFPDTTHLRYFIHYTAFSSLDFEISSLLDIQAEHLYLRRMRTQILLAVCSFSTFWSSLAAPSALLQHRDTTSCPTGPLTADTWNSSGVDAFLASWSAVNVTVTPTDNVQSLAASFGAPNFFWLVLLRPINIYNLFVKVVWMKLVTLDSHVYQSISPHGKLPHVGFS